MPIQINFQWAPLNIRQQDGQCLNSPDCSGDPRAVRYVKINDRNNGN